MKQSGWQTAELTNTFLHGVRDAIPQASLQLQLMEHILRLWCPVPRLILDLGCGDGLVGRFLLERFAHAKCVFLDFSDPMLQEARRKLTDKGAVKVVKGDFSSSAWLHSVESLGSFDVVASRFAIHHQADERKKQLYKELFNLLGSGGVLLNMEHVSSVSAPAQELFDTYFIEHLHQFHQNTAPQRTLEEVANTYYNRPDKAENRLAAVETQCAWLREIGFKDVDCYFKIFELALFGGRKSQSQETESDEGAR